MAYMLTDIELLVTSHNIDASSSVVNYNFTILIWGDNGASFLTVHTLESLLS